MRRAMRHAHLLGAKEPLMYRLVPALVAEMGAAYPGAGPRPAADRGRRCSRRRPRFRQTLVDRPQAARRGDRRLEQGGTLAGETAFKLYDTYGFPYDLTEDALRARGLEVDRAGFDSAMAEQKARRARPGRARAPRPPKISGSTLPRSMARPSSPAIPAMKARAWFSRSSRTAQRVEQAEIGRDRRCPPQPDALLRRERRPDR